MSDKDYKTNYDVDIDEYRALFQRIESGGQKYAQAESENSGTGNKTVKDTRVKRTYSGKTTNGMSAMENFDFKEIPSMTKKVIKKAVVDFKNSPERELPLITKLYKASVIIFAAVLVSFGFISAVDKNKTVSEKENRALAQKPEFSFSSFFSGEYNVAIENFYSDHFPARDFFISCNKKISGVFKEYSAGEDGEVLVSYQKDSNASGEGVNLFTDEQKKNGGMKENTAAITPDDQASVQGSLLIAGDRALEIYYHSDDNAQKYADMINKAAASMPAGVKFYNMLCPTAIEFYGTAEYREGVHSQRDSIMNVYSRLDSSVTTVDAYSNLVDSSADYIYFRTDHHWTARGAYCGYKAFCDASGNTAPALDTFKTHKLDGFLGSLYRESPSDALANNPDYVECFELAVDAKNMAYLTADMSPENSSEAYVVANTVNDSNKYLAFIAGDQPLEKITTSVRNGKKIIVIKESYGNALVPFLCNNYEEIYVVDPRQIDMNLPDFAEKNGITEVLAINYLFAIGNSYYCSEFNNMLN